MDLMSFPKKHHKQSSVNGLGEQNLPQGNNRSFEQSSESLWVTEDWSLLCQSCGHSSLLSLYSRHTLGMCKG